MTDTLRAGTASIGADSQISAGWFLRRALMTIIILCVAIGGIAWLLHASIDQSNGAIAVSQPAGTSTDTSSIKKP